MNPSISIPKQRSFRHCDTAPTSRYRMAVHSRVRSSLSRPTIAVTKFAFFRVIDGTDFYRFAARSVVSANCRP